MHGDVFLLVLLVVAGCAAFLFCVLYMFCRFFAWVGRGVFGGFRPRSTVGQGCGCGPGGSERRRVCPNERCRNVEYRDARYCSQCGSDLR